MNVAASNPSTYVPTEGQGQLFDPSCYPCTNHVSQEQLVAEYAAAHGIDIDEPALTVVYGGFAQPLFDEVGTPTYGDALDTLEVFELERAITRGEDADPQRA